MVNPSMAYFADLHINMLIDEKTTGAWRCGGGTSDFLRASVSPWFF